MSEPAVRVEGLKKNFGEVEALTGVDFEVPPGTVYGLLGPNGAGKTTTIRVLSTILNPDAGRAEIFGLDVVKDADAVRRTIGLAGQFAAVDPTLTGAENLRLVGRLAQMRRDDIPGRTTELLERFELADAADRPAKTYSGGMRRRLDVAASLMTKPPVLFLDEPTTGLDIQTRRELWEMVRELVAEGTTVLLTTQYLEEADQLASRIAVVDHGRVIAEDTPAALKDQLGSTVIEVGLGEPDVAARAAGILAGLADSDAEQDGTMVRLTTTVGTHVLVEGLRALDGAGIEPVDLDVREPSLDDVFLRLTGHRAEATDDEVEPSEVGAGSLGSRKERKKRERGKKARGGTDA